MIPLTELCHSCPHRNTAHCNSCATDRMPPPHQVTCFLTRSQQRITIVGAHLAPEEPEEQTAAPSPAKDRDELMDDLDDSSDSEEVGARSKRRQKAGERQKAEGRR